MAGVFTPLQWLLDGCLHALSSRLTRWTKPLMASLPLATLADLGRSKSELVAENALLRQQLIILKRQVKRPPITWTDRILLVLLARVVRTWQQALFIVQPDTLRRLASGALSLVLETQVKGLFPPALHARSSHKASTRAKVEHLSAHERCTDLGVRRAYRSPICSFDRSQAFFVIELKSRKVIHVGVRGCV
jgi:hypothetical protein